jgi:hypothetical protein
VLLAANIISFPDLPAECGFFADLQCDGIEGITLAEFTDYTGLRLIDENGRLLDDLPKMNTFLNRLLALRIEIQNLLFADFERRIAERIKQAKANGTYDRGVETLWADGGFDVVESQVLTTHSAGSETTCYSIDKLNKLPLLR